MKTTKKQKKSNLKISLLLLLLAAVLLISSTYAWFIANNQVQVGTLQVEVKAVEGIQISEDAISWDASIDATDLKTATDLYTGAVNQLPIVMRPVSTAADAAQIAGGKLPMFLGDVQSKNDEKGNPYNVLTATAQTEEHMLGTTGEETKYYIAFDMFLKYDGADATKSIYAQGGSGATFAATEGDNTTKYLERATRIAFIKQGTVASGAGAAAAQGLSYNTTEDGTKGFYLWEPNCDQHTDTAKTTAQGYYGINPASITTAPVAYSGVKAGITNANDVKIDAAAAAPKYWNESSYGDYFKNAPAARITTVEGFTTNTKLFDITPGITKIRVYMWVEGQDIDCINEASGTNIKFDLKLTTVAPPAVEP